MRLGDSVSAALSVIGITEERISRWLARAGYAKGCGCSGRRDKLNALGRWAVRILSGKTEKAEEYLEEMIED